MSEVIIKYCAPTLAGLKVGNLFSYKFENKKYLVLYIKQTNEVLNKKGVYLTILKISEDKALMFIYRKNKLSSLLKDKKIQNFLSSYGYNTFSIKECFIVLRKHLLKSDFPHEIGVFLGYPLSDIEKFIENKGMCYKLCGYWKVYTNKEEAKKTFDMFHKCTKIYTKKMLAGFDINKLTVSS